MSQRMASSCCNYQILAKGRQPFLPGHKSAVFQKILHRHADVLGDLSQQDGRKIASRVKRNGGAAAIRMSKLLMRSALANFLKPKPLQNGNHNARFEDGDAGHSCNFDGLHPDKLRLKTWGAVLAQHFNHFFEIGIDLVQRRGLGMRTGKTGDVTHIKPCVRATLDYCCISFHKQGPLYSDAWHFSSLRPRA